MNLEYYLKERDHALRTLDVEWATRNGCPADIALPALHKARYECLAIEDALRQESREWLTAHGMSRMHGEPWPDGQELPK